MALPEGKEQKMRISDIAGPGYVFYPLMLMMFAFAVVVAAPTTGEALLRLVIWLVAFVIVCGVPFVVAYKFGKLSFE